MTDASKRGDVARRVWNELATQDVLGSILDSPRMRDPQQRESAFREAGDDDAWRLAAFVHPAMTVVDLGCGIGRVMRPLARRCREIVGVDVSEVMLDRARAYLDGIDNVRLVQGSGRDLAGFADGSVDFLYSLLCFIHVDKRSAFRYLRELRRVLRPHGLALLQFQNILTERGMEKFGEVLDSDYPLEFYTPEEVAWLLRRSGLEPLRIVAAEEYIYATILNGPADEWLAGIRASVTVEEVGATGVFAGESVDAGTLAASVRSAGREPLTVKAVLRLSRADGESLVLSVEALLTLEPSRVHEVEFRCGPGGEVVVTSNGAPIEQRVLATEEPLSASGLLEVGLLPAGFTWSGEAVDRFGHLVRSQELRSSTA